MVVSTVRGLSHRIVAVHNNSYREGWATGDWNRFGSLCLAAKLLALKKHIHTHKKKSQIPNKTQLVYLYGMENWNWRPRLQIPQMVSGAGVNCLPHHSIMSCAAWLKHVSILRQTANKQFLLALTHRLVSSKPKWKEPHQAERAVWRNNSHNQRTIILGALPTIWILDTAMKLTDRLCFVDLFIKDSPKEKKKKKKKRSLYLK